MRMNFGNAVVLSVAGLAATMISSPFDVGGPNGGIFFTQAVALDAGGDGEGGGGGDSSGGGGEGGGGGDPAGGDRGQGQGQSGGPGAAGGGGNSGADADGGQGGGGVGGGPGGVGERGGGKGAVGAVGGRGDDGAEAAHLGGGPKNESAISGFSTITDPRSAPAIEMRSARVSSGAGLEAEEPPSPPQAILRLREGAERGDAEAQFGLAVAYEKGLGVGQDITWAARWYGRAAFRGHSEAQYKYARLKLAEARRGGQDLSSAYRWLAVAAQQGHMMANGALSELEPGLTIDQIYRAKAWAEAFEPTTSLSLWDRPTVEYLQKKLADLGYDPGPVDGRMGPRTVAALDRYKAVRGWTSTPGFSEEMLRAIHQQARKDSPLIGTSSDGASAD